MDKFYDIANIVWVLWLTFVFLVIAFRTYSPSKQQNKKMQEASRIPLKND